jgi:hypothetical protein
MPLANMPATGLSLTLGHGGCASLHQVVLQQRCPQQLRMSAAQILLPWTQWKC